MLSRHSEATPQQPGNIEALLRRLDGIEPSVALAQFAQNGDPFGNQPDPDPFFDQPPPDPFFNQPPPDPFNDQPPLGG